MLKAKKFTNHNFRKKVLSFKWTILFFSGFAQSFRKKPIKSGFHFVLHKNPESYLQFCESYNLVCVISAPCKAHFCTRSPFPRLMTVFIWQTVRGTRWTKTLNCKIFNKHLEIQPRLNLTVFLEIFLDSTAICIVESCQKHDNLIVLNLFLGLENIEAGQCGWSSQ